jgi:hypothetical protein
MHQPLRNTSFLVPLQPHPILHRRHNTKIIILKLRLPLLILHAILLQRQLPACQKLRQHQLHLINRKEASRTCLGPKSKAEGIFGRHAHFEGRLAGFVGLAQAREAVAVEFVGVATEGVGVGCDGGGGGHGHGSDGDVGAGDLEGVGLEEDAVHGY